VAGEVIIALEQLAGEPQRESAFEDLEFAELLEQPRYEIEEPET
jgi:hypothetical protein